MKKKRFAMFDADGTLIDSVRSHAIFFHDINEMLKLRIGLPDVDDIDAWKSFAASPFRAYLINAGFPEKRIDEVLGIYKEKFDKDERYIALPYGGISNMIRMLRDEEISSGILTSNYKDYVAKCLGKTERLMELIIDLSVMDDFYPAGKSDALRRIQPFVYVGDMESDYIAAAKVGVPFIGVDWGWEIKSDDKRFPVAKTAEELTELILKL